jgi:alpha-ketoglutarate-dependent taurine dioxygenase
MIVLDTELANRLHTRRLTPFIGSEVLDVDLKQPLPPETVAAIRALVLERGVAFFRDQSLTPQQQLDFTAKFGPIQFSERVKFDAPLPGVKVFDSRDELYGRVSRWHADLTSSEAPWSFEVLQAITVPETGGDTMWSSTQAAYDRLPEALQRLAESLTAIHALTPLRVSEWGNAGRAYQWKEHPVVTVHPETGRRALFVNPRYTAEIVGYKPHLSEAVLKVLFDHLLQPEFSMRLRWTPGTVVVWDNRTTLHYAIDDYDDELRIVHTCSVVGERPVGVTKG